MAGLKSASRAAALAAALPLFGCGMVLGGYDLAPNGLPRSEDELRRALAFEPEAAYEEVIEGKRPLPDDDLLRLMYAGTAARYAGRHEESSHLLDLASYLADDRVTISVSKEALSMILNDRVLAYTTGRSERLMIPYLSAVNYLEMGNLEAAAVEARRIEALLDRFDEGVAPADLSEDSRFLHFFAGGIFEAAGDVNAASVAYRRAGPLAADAVAALDSRAGRPASDSGDVVVLIERGFAPHRVEQSVAIVLPPKQVEMLTDGSPGEVALAATEAAVRILATASHLYGDRGPYYRDRGYQRSVHIAPWDEDACRRSRGSGCVSAADDAGRQPYLMRISWPVLYQEESEPGPVRVRAGDRSVDPAARLDLAAAVLRDFQVERPTIVARTVVRAAAKLALASSLAGSGEKKEKKKEKDEEGEEAGQKEENGTGGEIARELLGAIANIGTMLTERADTRCWHLLPASISMVRLRLPAGTHDLALEPDAGGGRGPGVSLGTVTVPRGGTAFVSQRLWR